MKQYIFEFGDFNRFINVPVPIDEAFGILGDTDRRSKFGEQTGYFKSLLKKAKEMGLDAYVFTDFNPKGTVAWSLDENGNWKYAKRGYPKVFYNRSFRRRKNLGGKSSTTYLTEMGCTPLNSADFRKLALDKYATFHHLTNEDLKGLGLPYTEKFTNEGLVPFLNNKTHAILKPRYGSGGKGIIKVSKNGSGYEIQYQDYKINCPEDQLLERIDAIRKKMKMDGRRYIIQEYIQLPKYNDSVFDIRVIYQKGKDGVPLRTGMAVRTAAPNKITANLHQGGGKSPLSEILEGLFNQDMNGPIAESIRSHAKNLFEILDKKVGPIGEIGIDFLLDPAGNVHLIEVNSVPGRNLFKIIPEIREVAIRRPVEYAKYLLDQSKNGEQ